MGRVEEAHMVAIQAPPGGGSGAALDFLQARGIPYDAWPIPAEVAALQAKPALSDDEKAAVLAAFRPRLESENEARGYIMADMVVLSPETPGLDEMLAKFDKAHYHDDDEVRYIFAGEGVFGFEPEDGEPFAVTVSAGDYIIVPAGTYHWFTLTEARHVKAIRLFKDTTGWAPHYRES